MRIILFWMSELQIVNSELPINCRIVAIRVDVNVMYCIICNAMEHALSRLPDLTVNYLDTAT